MKRVLFLVLCFYFSNNCVSQEFTFINCNHSINIRFEKISYQDSVLLVLDFKNMVDKLYFIHNKIRVRWTTDTEYLDIYWSEGISRQLINSLTKVSKGEKKVMRFLIEKPKKPFFRVKLRGNYIAIDNPKSKINSNKKDFYQKNNQRWIYYDFDTNLTEG